MGGREDLADPTVETLDHPIGLGMAGWNQPVLDVVFSTGLIEVVLTAGLVAALEKSIGELGAVIGEEFGDLEGGGGGQSFQESRGPFSRFFGMDFQIHPAGGPIDLPAGRQVATKR